MLTYMKFRKFISELIRRNVFKAVIAYLAVAWVIVQIASIVLPAFEAPSYALKVIIYLLAVGLMFWVVFSWVYDLTSEGFKRTDDIEDSEEVSKLTNRRLNRVIAGALTTAVLILIAVSFWAGAKYSEGPDPNQKQKIAVIPFNAVEGDSLDEYFIFGMTDGLIEELSRVEQFTVISQLSTRFFEQPVSEASMLFTEQVEEIEHFIYGDLSFESNRLKIHVQLRESLESEAVWAKEYSDDITKVKFLWSEVSRDLSRHLGLEILPEDQKKWADIQQVNPETYELYLKGNHFLNKPTLGDWAKGLVFLEEAKDKNPGDTHAWAALAEGYVNLGHGPSPSKEVFPKARQAALRAIQLDSTNAKGWAALAHYHTYFGMDWELADYAFHRANELNPNLAYNHYHRAWYLALFGRMNEAIYEHKLAQELDPFTSLNTSWLGELYRWLGLYDEAMYEVNKILDFDENDLFASIVKSYILMDQGEIEQSIALGEKVYGMLPPWGDMVLGYILPRLGKIEEAKALISRLESSPMTSWNALVLGLSYMEIGNESKALEWFNYQDKNAFYPWIRIWAHGKSIEKNPEFLKLIRDMNLPDPAPLVYN